MVEKFKSAPLRQRLGIPAFGIVLGLCVWATEARGPFDGLTLLIAASGLLLGLIGLLPNRPKLKVTDRDKKPRFLIPRQPIRPIDSEKVIEAQEEACRAEMPRQPRARFPANSMFASMERLGEQLDQYHSLAGHASDDTLRKHLGKIREYEQELEDWLPEAEKARTDRLRLFDGELRVYEAGHAAADHVQLRLRFPEGFELDDDDPEVPEPPEPPKFSYGVIGPRIGSDMALLASRLNRIPGAASILQRDDEPQYSVEDGKPVIDFELGHINQRAYRPVPLFSLKAPREQGRYVVQWELSASTLPEATVGTIAFELPGAVEGKPITSLAEVRAELEQHGL